MPKSIFWGVIVRHVPMRTCILSGDEKPKRELLRIVRVTDCSILTDEVGRMHGGRCYVCWDKTEFDPRKIDVKIRRALRLGNEIPRDDIEQVVARFNSG